MEAPTKHGFLKIRNEEERAALADLLFKNNYTVNIARRKKDGKSFEYFVEFELRDREIKEETT